MKPLTGAEVREAFLSFFESKCHLRLPSASLVPADDPTLLFTGAGMNQFKDMFLGKGNLSAKRVCTAQKCIRVPDLENVGVTPRHHTLFEMLGNFSFGNYFKEDCIAWEWEFFTQRLEIPAAHLVVSVYLDDEEAYNTWLNRIGIPPERIFRFGEKENFWPAEAPSKGPDGPCGPCSEIYFDARPDEPLPQNAGLTELPEQRFTEIGNCVFTQFDRQSDGSLPPLPQKNIDVGLGLERIVAVLCGAPTNFDTDLFLPYIRDLEQRTGKTYGADADEDSRMRRIADHLRALVFTISDGVVPSNEGRGYVVRKILRKAERDGFKLGLREPFLFSMAELVPQIMGMAYPEVQENLSRVQQILVGEEEAFHQVYSRGVTILEEELGRLSSGAALFGQAAFALHDTHGFPFDMILDECKERGYAVDEEGFRAQMEEQRRRSRRGSQLSTAVFATSPEKELTSAVGVPTHFCGDVRDREIGIVQRMLVEKKLVESASAGAAVVFAVDQTPFYAEGGGQVGDRGSFSGEDGLQGTIKQTIAVDGIHLHYGKVTAGQLKKGDHIQLEIDTASRRSTERNHTATHLLHAALREVLGDHVQQAGSLVTPERLRFDFTHQERLGDEQIRKIEDLVNGQALRAVDVIARELSAEEAKQAGFMALFGEKYGDHVRGVVVGEFSRELCGGTHVRNSGAIGTLVITHEGSVAAGTRRIEAVTGDNALALLRSRGDILARIGSRIKVPLDRVEARVESLVQEIKDLKQEVEKARTSGVADSFSEMMGEAKEVDGHHVFFWHTQGLAIPDLASLVDRIRSTQSDFVALLASVLEDGKVALVAAADGKTLKSGAHAGKILGDLARRLGGGGGGRPNFAKGQGGASDGLEQGMNEIFASIMKKLGADKG